MQIAIALAAGLFIYLCGRNDGGPLLALPLQFQRRHLWVPLLFLTLCVPIVVDLGLRRVAADLERLADPVVATSDGRLVLVMLLAVLATLALSTFLNAPTSITLALIGSLAGVALGSGVPVPWMPLIRIVALGIAAPVVSALLSFLVRTAQLHMTLRRPTVGGRVALLQGGYYLLLIAYATNDGQKMLFALSLALGVNVNEARNQFGWVLVGAGIFAFGALAGVISSSRFIRHDIARTSVTTLTTAEYTAAAAVLVGSSMGAPLSVTQSISGGLAGTGLAMSPRGVHWKGVRRIAVTWVWTLPVAALTAYLLALLAALITT